MKKGTLRYKSASQIPSRCSIAKTVGLRSTNSRPKYGNQSTTVNGITFPSKKEAAFYLELILQKAANAIRGFARQVSILLPSGRRIRLDFVVFENDGRVRWIDTKGYVTEGWAIKRDEAQAAWGIQIETV